MKYKNLILIGTSHIAKQSMDEVKEAIETEKPDIVALELDRNRLVAMTSRKKGKGVSLADIRHIGFKGFLFSLIGAWAEKKLGEHVGVSPGSEMLTAVKIAKKQKADIALIDQDIRITLKRFSESLTWKEKWNFFVDIVKGIVLRKPIVKFDLRTVPSKDIIKKLTREVKKRYPNVHKVLIEERNKVMARNLAKMMVKDQKKKIVAVVGAGHEEDIIKLIEKDIKQGNVYSVSYSFSVG